MTSQGQSVVSARREFGERARDGQSQDPTFVANPKTEEEYFQNGNALMVAGDWVKAEQNFRSAISLRSDNAIYHIALIFALANQQRWSETMPEIKVCGKLNKVGWLLSILERPTPRTIAYVYTDQFKDADKGIKAYLAAVKKGQKAKQHESEQIGIALDEFATAHSIGLIFDATEMESIQAPVQTGQSKDITAVFIESYNRSHSGK